MWDVVSVHVGSPRTILRGTVGRPTPRNLPTIRYATPTLRCVSGQSSATVVGRTLHSAAGGCRYAAPTLRCVSGQSSATVRKRCRRVARSSGVSRDRRRVAPSWRWAAASRSAW